MPSKWEQKESHTLFPLRGTLPPALFNEQGLVKKVISRNGYQRGLLEGGDSNQTNTHGHAVSVMSNPKDVFVIIGLTTKDPNNGTISQHYKALISAKKITVHNFEFCQIYNDLALIELSENVSEAASVPICMPSENMQLHGVLYASGSGVDCAIARNTLIDQDQGECGQRVVAQKFYGVDEPSHKILAQAFSKSPRPGDGGGPLFQVDKSDIHTLVGITSHTYDDEKWKSDTSGSK
ncbi:hypothetical protein ANCDUO_05244 [Ancylostoma duodenale]|uniref:Peptidase S1 domain-containing protein n=1 Tax=Ancylostoma duodenale TaxID=51022 RepID=A0A0C2D4M7_9BILA|nr:hypothetical protein ANCDUO_05244 [Ancylostoma duodenale]